MNVNDDDVVSPLCWDLGLDKLLYALVDNHDYEFGQVALDLQRQIQLEENIDFVVKSSQRLRVKEYDENACRARFCVLEQAGGVDCFYNHQWSFLEQKI